MARPNNTKSRTEYLEGAPKGSRDFRIQTHKVEDSVDQANVCDATVHALTTTPTRLSLPEAAEVVYLRNVNANYLVWIGKSADFVPGTSDCFPLRELDPPLRIRLEPGNDSLLYAAVDTGTGVMYSLATYREA